MKYRGEYYLIRWKFVVSKKSVKRQNYNQDRSGIVDHQKLEIREAQIMEIPPLIDEKTFEIKLEIIYVY